MNASLSDRIDLLNESFEVILRTTVNNVRDQFIAELNSKAREIESSSSPFGHISWSGANQFGTQNTERYTSAGQSQQLRRQVGYRRVYHIWFATITVTSRSATTQQSLDTCGDTRSSFHNYTSSRITIDVRPHPWITLRGMFGFINRRSRGTSSLDYDARLRSYNLIPYTAPIVTACITGDIASARYLFAIGEASPYDVAIHTQRNTIYGYDTLLDLTIRSWRGTVSDINESKFSDDISDEIEVLKRKFELFSFLVDCGLSPGEQMKFVPGNVSNLLELAYSSPPSILAQYADMLRCLVTRSASNPFDFSRRYQTSIFYALMDVVPEVASCIRSQEFWPLPEPLGEGEYGNLKDKFPWFYIRENAYNLLHDPTAIYMRARLKWMALKPSACIYMVGACLSILRKSQSLPDYESGAWDAAIKARLIACLEFGMNPKNTAHVYEMEAQGSVAQYYMLHGKKNLLESALLLVDGHRILFASCLKRKPLHYWSDFSTPLDL
jgi:hypothetical protein